RDLLRVPAAAQVVIGGLGQAEAVHDPPPCPRPQVLEEPDEAAAVPAVAAAPFGKDLRHHLAGHDPAELQVAGRVEAAQLDRVHGEQVLQVEVAYVVEV